MQALWEQTSLNTSQILLFKTFDNTIFHNNVFYYSNKNGKKLN